MTVRDPKTTLLTLFDARPLRLIGRYLPPNSLRGHDVSVISTTIHTTFLLPRVEPCISGSALGIAR